VASKASKSLNQTVDADGKVSDLANEMDSLLNDLSEQQSELDSVNQSFAGLQDDDKELWEELEQMEQKEK
jgi:chromosome segregation ATPase